jgi:hypothetical protein
LCFDQVDNLDPEQVGALTRFLEALLDSAANLLVVTAGVKATLLDFRQAKVIQDSAWDRVAQVELSLQRITPAEARQLVRVRLDPFFQALADMPALQERREREPLFPLGEDWAEEFLGNKIEVRPRDVLSWAREGWRRLQRREDADGATGSVERNGGTRAPSSAPTPQTIQLAIDQRVEEQVRAHREQRLQRRDTLPPDPENLSGLLAALIQQCQQADLGYGLEGLQRVVSGQLTRTKPYGLIVLHRCDSTQGTLRTGLVFLSTTSALATTAALRCLLQDRRPPHRVLVITDERQPLKFGRQQYAQGRAYFEELRQRGPERFQVVELSFAQYATLDALRAVTGMARSGELEAELSGGQVRPITEVEVRASHHRQGRYLAADLLRLILAPGMNQGGKRT